VNSEQLNSDTFFQNKIFQN